MLLDIALGPGPDGYEVCRTLRARRNVVPIIMLTALDSEADAVLGLEAGGDDYVTKPFGLAELRSRIRAVLRRTGQRGGGSMGSEVLTVGPITLDRSRREVTIDGEPVRLTFSEFELLDALMTDPGRLLNRQELLRAIWGDSAYRDPRAIDVHIRHLREKLEPEPDKPQVHPHRTRRRLPARHRVAPHAAGAAALERLRAPWPDRRRRAGRRPRSASAWPRSCCCRGSRTRSSNASADLADARRSMAANAQLNSFSHDQVLADPRAAAVRRQKGTELSREATHGCQRSWSSADD